MWREALETVTPAIWKNSIKHSENEVVKWYNREHILDQQETLPLIINTEDGSSSDSDIEESE